MKKPICCIILGLLFQLSYGQNLLTNPSAETAPTSSGWTSVATGTIAAACFTFAGDWRIVGNQDGYPAAQDGSFFFFSGCGFVNGEIFQEIDVSARATDIDAGNQTFTFSGYTQSFNQVPTDGAEVRVEYRDGTSTVLETYTTGVTTNIGGVWVESTDTRTAPVNTRAVRVRLLSTSALGESVDGYFDNISLTTNLPLPIDLLNFNVAAVDNKMVEIKWQTTTEINNEFFTIERSQDGIAWTTIKKMDGAGNSSSLLSYQTMDMQPLPGISYYRLKQTDFNGDFEYSTVRSAYIKSIEDKQIMVYHHRDLPEVRIKGNATEISAFDIFNMLGQNVNTFVASSKDSEEVVKIDLTNLPPGIYTIKTRHNTEKFYKR